MELRHRRLPDARVPHRADPCLLRSLEVSLLLQGRPCGRPPAAAVLAPAATPWLPGSQLTLRAGATPNSAVALGHAQPVYCRLQLPRHCLMVSGCRRQAHARTGTWPPAMIGRLGSEKLSRAPREPRQALGQCETRSQDLPITAIRRTNGLRLPRVLLCDTPCLCRILPVLYYEVGMQSSNPHSAAGFT
jgi:hypothetical protein